MAKLTVIVPCKNEETNIAACLETVKWADEIFVVDSGSEDATVEIAKKYTDRVVFHEYVNSATQKNWSIPQATHEWVMIIDADERATPELQTEIQSLLSGDPDHDGYRMHRRNWFFGYPIRHCGWERDSVLRLFKRDISRYEDKHVHADVIVEGGNVGWLNGEFEHHTYRSFDQYLEKFGRYTTWGALDARDKGGSASVFNLTFRPVFRFIKMYLFRQGFRDGKAGLILCTLASFSVWMKFAKLWIIRRVENGDERVDIGRTEW